MVIIIEIIIMVSMLVLVLLIMLYQICDAGKFMHILVW